MRTTILSSATTLMLCVLSVHYPLGCFYFFQGGLKNCFYSQLVWIADFLAVSSLYRVLNWRYMWGIVPIPYQFRTFAYGMVLTRQCKGGGLFGTTRDSWGRARIDKQEQSKIDIICVLLETAALAQYCSYIFSQLCVSIPSLKEDRRETNKNWNFNCLNFHWTGGCFLLLLSC